MGKVLIVDNDRTTVSLLKILLELDGHTVLIPGRPNNLVEEVLETAPDVVLMDVFLTGDDGLDLLRRLRAHPELGRLPVLMCSGMDLAEECAAAGADGFLLKPYTPEQLTQALADAMSPRGPAVG